MCNNIDEPVNDLCTKDRKSGFSVCMTVCLSHFATIGFWGVCRHVASELTF